MTSFLSLTAMTTVKEKLHKFNKRNTSMRTLNLMRKLQWKISQVDNQSAKNQ